MTPIILCFTSYYLPGYLAGGPVKSIKNMIDLLGEDYDFRVVTRNHDINQTNQYELIENNSWNQVGKSKVFYLSDYFTGYLQTLKILRQKNYQMIYVNSFFDIKIFLTVIILRRLLGLTSVPILIAPRGEFSIGAIKIKKIRKFIYKSIFVKFFIDKYVFWHASTEFESIDIKRELYVSDINSYVAKNICIGLDIPKMDDQFSKHSIVSKVSGNKLVFLSRISPKKNLIFLLKVMKKISSPITLDIYGPIEDQNYWLKCKEIIDEIGFIHDVSYKGVVDPDNVTKIFSKYDLFVFPTFGENFGHVIYEALNAELPVIVSDQTPWKPDKHGILKTIPLDADYLWVNEIENFINMIEDEKVILKSKFKDYKNIFFNSDKILEDNKKMFESLLRK